MHKQLMALLRDLRVRRNFNATDWMAKKTAMFNDYMSRHGLSGVVVSVSGGVDSAVALGLAVAASRCEGSPIKRVLGIAQPIHSTDSIWRRALELRDAFNAEVSVVNQSDCFDLLSKKVEEAVGVKGEMFASGQLKSYMRTPTGYYAAQLLSQQGFPCVVMGTGNRDEDGYLKYFCKAGDGVVDVQLLADLHKSEVFTVAKHLNVPKSILEAPPSADLWEGQTDEGELGFSYDFIEMLTEWMALPEEERRATRKAIVDDASEEWDRCAKLAETIHIRNGHKDGVVNLNLLPS